MKENVESESKIRKEKRDILIAPLGFEFCRICGKVARPQHPQTAASSQQRKQQRSRFDWTLLSC